MNTTQESLLSAVWLLATLNGDARKSGRKNVAKINIMEACQCIIDASDTLNLRKTSNLMYGTVLAYKNKCLWNWKDVNSCRMSIKRLGFMAINTTHFDDGSNTEGKGGGIKLFTDDPKFDITFGLVEDFKNVSQRIKESSNQDSLCDSLLYLNDYREEESNAREEKRFATLENWDQVDLNFRFDANGNVIEDSNVDTVISSEAEIREIFEDFNVLEGIPEFDLDVERKEGAPTAKGEDTKKKTSSVCNAELLTPPPTKKRKQTKKKNQSRRKLVFDYKIEITGLQLREIRDGYIQLEKRKLQNRHALNKKLQLDMMVNQMLDTIRYKQGYNKTAHMEERCPSFENIEHGCGPMKSRSRSSSVSSVEVGRRAVDSRHSSSFQFDFLGNHIDDNGEETEIGNIAQLDITFDLEKLENISSMPIDQLEEQIGGSTLAKSGDARIRFSDLAPAGTAGEVSRKFMFVLRLASNNRISVEQIGLFTDIYIKKKWS